MHGTISELISPSLRPDKTALSREERLVLGVTGTVLGAEELVDLEKHVVELFPRRPSHRGTHTSRLVQIDLAVLYASKQGAKSEKQDEDEETQLE